MLMMRMRGGRRDALLTNASPCDEGAFSLGARGQLESLLESAGYSPVAAGEVDCPFAYGDRYLALRALLSAGAFVAAVRQVGEEAVGQSVTAVLAD